MLDSYVDLVDDEASGNHSYISHYPDEERAVQRLAECITRAARGALSLPKGHRHTVIVCAMVAMYLSKDSARLPRLRSHASQLLAAGGSLTRLLMPVLRLWRIAYSQRAD
jgi:tetraprenyl-beta-curcumene synthase